MVKMKPGQQLHIVNQLYQYTVQFKEDPSSTQGSAKRPRELASEDREGPSIKAAKQTENVPVSGSHGEAKKSNVRKKGNVDTDLRSTLFFIFDVNLLIILQESFGHWSQGLRASMQDPKMQVVQFIIFYCFILQTVAGELEPIVADS